MTEGLFILAALCLLYYGIIVYHAGWKADFAWIWPVFAVFALAIGAVFQFQYKLFKALPAGVIRCIEGIFCIGIVVFILLCLLVIKGMCEKGSSGLEYVIVLGAQVKGIKPSRALKRRLECAYSYAKKNPDTRLILSGGQGEGEDITEALCMAQWMIRKGIDKQRLILEERSVNTRENLIFSDQLTGCAERKTGILSNNFHVYRALKLAKKAGYLYPEGIAAESDPIMQLHYVIREVAAIIKEILVRNI